MFDRTRCEIYVKILSVEKSKPMLNETKLLKFLSSIHDISLKTVEIV